MNVRTGQLKVGLVGKDGRTSAIKQALEANPRVVTALLSTGKGHGAVQETIDATKQQEPDWVVVGPEEPLEQGVVDELEKLGIRCIGPTKELARLESSKSFTRSLVAEFGIPGNPEYRVFTSLAGVEDYLYQLGEFVIKPDGLTGGKGVKVFGDHLQSVCDGVDYCRELFQIPNARVIIEEKLEGEEFSLQSFCDGTNVKHMIVVQDHKRAHDGDTGPNTGGMGSYSCSDHSLPFLTAADVANAQRINELIPHALFKKTGQKYKGILFGGFMATKNGVRLLEYNARFGDPESLNVLSLLETDLAEIFEAMIAERLDSVDVRFKNQASVCRYIVPNGYPAAPQAGTITNVPVPSKNLRVYQAAVDPQPDGSLVMTGSRALALVGIGESLEEANGIVEAALTSVTGTVFYRTDIGTNELIERRKAHMRRVRSYVPRISEQRETRA